MNSEYCRHYKSGDCIRYEEGVQSKQCGDCDDFEMMTYTEMTFRRLEREAQQKKGFSSVKDEKHGTGCVRMTNAERIRAMSDDDLADFLDTITDCCNAPFSKCEKCPMKYKDATPRCNISEWLKQEVSEDAGTD